jgi:hypothetical protein
MPQNSFYQMLYCQLYRNPPGKRVAALLEKGSLITPTCRNHAGLRPGKRVAGNSVNSQATVDNSNKGTFEWEKSR